MKIVMVVLHSSETNKQPLGSDLLSYGNNRNICSNESSGEEEQQSGKIRIGKDYQCDIPRWIPEEERKVDQCIERELLVWSPSPSKVSDSLLDEYIHTAKEKYGYTMDQALGMLFWHQHDLERSTQDLANFTPFPDEWNEDDKVLFDQAFQFHGKSFHRIRQMIPNKSVGQLVKYYYTWKKARTMTSLIDNQAKKLRSQIKDQQDIIVIDDGSEMPEKEEEESNKPKCSNCSILCNVTHATPKGELCGTCFNHYERTARLRPTIGPDRKEGKASAKPPKGMYINHDDLVALAKQRGGGENLLKSMDREIESLKRLVQRNKQVLAGLALKTHKVKIAKKYKMANRDINAKWTQEEQLLGVQGIRKFGKDFAAIADIIGTKTESHVHSFFVNYQRRYNLANALKEFEKGTIEEKTCIANNDEPEIIELD